MVKTEKWDERKFKQWLKYRTDLNEAKRNNAWESVILICNKIIEFDQHAKFINIFIPIIRKDKCKALGKVQRYKEAIEEYQTVINELRMFRLSEPLSSPNDWLDEIEKVNKEICRLSRHL